MGWRKAEDQGTLSYFFLFLVIPLCLATHSLLSLHRRRRRGRFPPGPQPLPLIGNLLMMHKLTHRGLAELAGIYGGLLHLRIGSLHTVAVSTPDMAKQVLKIRDSVFSDRPASTAITYLTYGRADMAFAQYGPFWRQMRKLCVVKLFSRRRVESWASVRCETAKTVRAVAKQSGGRVEIGELIFALTNSIIFSAAFGSQFNDKEGELVAVVHEFSQLFGSFCLGDFYPWLSWLDFDGLKKRLKRARLSLDGIIENIIDDHLLQANPKPQQLHSDDDTDMVDDLLAFLRETDDGPAAGGHLQMKLTRNNIKAVLMDVIFGGTETVASLIEWTMAELMRWPEEMKRVQDELAEVVGLDRRADETDLPKLIHLKCAVKESLRLHPPIPLLPHQSNADCEVGGFYIPAGARVLVNAWAIGRDKSAWRDADAFIPSRFLPGQGDAADVDFHGSFFEFVPFGSGRRSCPGLQLGLYAVELALAELLHCFVWELPDGMNPSELNMDDVIGLTAPRAVCLAAVPTWRLTYPLEV